MPTPRIVPPNDLDTPENTELFTPYHNGQGNSRYPQIAPEDRRFIVWDGEGANDPNAKRKPQKYVLFGCYTGDEHYRISSPNLTSRECIEYILEIGHKHPGAWHVGFGFDYDSNMLVRNFSPSALRWLRNKGSIRYGKYRIEHLPGKWFQVTEYGENYDNDPNDHFTVKIFDILGFFQCSLVSALKKYLSDHPKMAAYMPIIEAGKAGRNDFRYDDIDEIEEYWRVENELLHALAIRLREMMYDPRVDIRITRWHGPGAIASYVYRTHEIQDHKANCGEDIYDKARYGYAGGRFELFRVGRHCNAYGIDINSAYCAAIAKLPSLSEGYWRRVRQPRKFVEFGIYHVRMAGQPLTFQPAPLFHRDTRGNITFPWWTDGWYWSPEIHAMIETMGAGASRYIQILEGYEYVGWETRPFAFVEDLYEQRKRMKREGIGAEYALKLALASLYGKMAQRAGWERNRRAPTWHQLEWAGWVTSYTRAMLYRQLHAIPWEHLIAVETDGLYTTMNPAELGIKDSKELGGWEITEYDEMIYLQSGVYAKRQGSAWTSKYRGLDQDSLSTRSIVKHSQLLEANTAWPHLVGTTTRFVGYRLAAFREDQGRGALKSHHCVWEKDVKEISSGSQGKRVHIASVCKACKAGANAYDMPHDLLIKSRAVLNDGMESQPHDIPWLDTDKAEWRNSEELLYDGVL